MQIGISNIFQQDVAGTLFVSGWAGHGLLFPEFSRHASFILPISRGRGHELGTALDKEWKTIFAWSLGAHLCLKNLSRLKTDRLILISPFLDFCRGDFRDRAQKMISGISRNPETTVRWFWKSCGIKKPPRPILDNVQDLRQGLEYLIKSRIISRTLDTDIPITLIHGLYDRIVPPIHSEEILLCNPQISSLFLPHGHYIPEQEIIKAAQKH